MMGMLMTQDQETTGRQASRVSTALLLGSQTSTGRDSQRAHLDGVTVAIHLAGGQLQVAHGGVEAGAAGAHRRLHQGTTIL